MLRVETSQLFSNARVGLMRVLDHILHLLRCQLRRLRWCDLRASRGENLAEHTAGEC